MEPAPRDRERPFRQCVFKGVTHCGGGCALGDIVGEWLAFWLGRTFAGIAPWPELMIGFALAFALGIVFQSGAIAPMRHLGLRDGVIAAFKADTLSLIAFGVGLFAWMAPSSFVFFHHDLHPGHPVHWFMMQAGMTIGFAARFPMNWRLIKKGVKEKR